MLSSFRLSHHPLPPSPRRSHPVVPSPHLFWPLTMLLYPRFLPVITVYHTISIASHSSSPSLSSSVPLSSLVLLLSLVPLSPSVTHAHFPLSPAVCPACCVSLASLSSCVTSDRCVAVPMRLGCSLRFSFDSPQQCLSWAELLLPACAALSSPRCSAALSCLQRPPVGQSGAL